MLTRQPGLKVRLSAHAILTIAISVCLLPMFGCETKSKSSAKKQGPAKLEHPNEGDIYRVVLTPKAEQRLQISTVDIQRKSVPRVRTIGGTVIVPDGAAIVVTAPVSGTLRAPGKTLPIAGQGIDEKQMVFQLIPMMAPEREVPTASERVSMANAKATLLSSQLVADRDVRQGQAEFTAAKISLSRSRKLFENKAGSLQEVENAEARFDMAKKTLDAASDRKDQLDKVTLKEKFVAAIDIPVLAPQAGMLQKVTSSVGQVVNVGAPLFEVVNLKTMWVRVPVYPGMIADIDRERDAKICKLGDDSETNAIPVAAPPSASMLASSVDIFYQLQNEGGAFSPSEPVEVALPMKGEAESLVVPRAAILRDIHGIAWVYVNSAEQEYRRHRVEIAFSTDELAVLSQGPAPGTPVVVEGAAELFGTEFGAGK